MKHGLPVAFLLLSLIRPAFGQVLRKGFSVQAGGQAGRSFAAHEVPALRQSGFVMDFNRQTSGERYWQADHRYPQVGVQFSARTFPGSNHPANAFTLVPYLEFNVLSTETGQLQIKHGTGLAYVTGSFKKSAYASFGSHLNASSLLDIGYQFRTCAPFTAKAGMLASHISNGNLRQPNAGLNSWLVYAQLIYFPGGQLETRIGQTIPTDFRRWRCRLYSAAGFYAYEPGQARSKENMQVGFLAFFQHGTRFRTGAGLELGRLEKKAGLQPAAYLEEEVLIGHLTTRYGVGMYLTEPLPDERRTYGKVGVAWYPFVLENQIARGISIGTTIKAHGFRAAHVELAAGYTW